MNADRSATRRADGSEHSGGDRKVLYASPVVLLVSVVSYGLAQESVLIVAVGAAVSAAAFGVGALLGFLFGIPRTLTTEAPEGLAEDERIRHRPNTNLEQISDWLTKVLVGVGLVQLTAIGSKLGSLGQQLAPALGSGPVAEVYGVSLLIGSSISGFLTAYIYTRLQLQRAFARADRGELSAVIADVVEAREDALNLVEKQLDPTFKDPIPQTDLNEAVAEAPPALQKRIYEMASRQRRESWRADKPAMAHTIPVFEALMSADPSERYHGARAQLGYALKDAIEHDYRRAYDLLTQAIEIRDRRGSRRFRSGLYEFCRAQASILLVASGAVKPSPERDRIVEDDLRAAMRDPNRLGEIITKDATVSHWMKKNNLTEESLTLPAADNTEIN